MSFVVALIVVGVAAVALGRLAPENRWRFQAARPSFQYAWGALLIVVGVVLLVVSPDNW